MTIVDSFLQKSADQKSHCFVGNTSMASKLEHRTADEVPIMERVKLIV